MKKTEFKQKNTLNYELPFMPTMTLRTNSDSKSQSESINFEENHRSFRDMMEKAFKGRSSSLPPKIELTGILIPLPLGSPCQFKLDTGASEHFLSMNSVLLGIAKKLEWEEVIAKGILDVDDGFFKVEKLTQRRPTSRDCATSALQNPFLEIENYKRVITRWGKIEIAPEFLAS